MRSINKSINQTKIDFMIKTSSLSHLMTFFGLLFSIIYLPYHLHAQDIFTTTDTIKKVTFEEVVITANRYENKIFNSGASVDIITSKQLNTLPISGISNSLAYTPGVYLSSTDGMGLNPQVMVRGFFGGGEAEYVNVMVDGTPINDLENGLVSWNLIPLKQVKRIEFLRGGSSPLYGDAAMGGVFNIITEKMDKPFTNASIGYGNFNTYNIGINHGGKVGSGNYEIFANNENTDGFREHSQWNSTTFGGKIKLPFNSKSSITISSYNQLLTSEDAGALSEEQIAGDREQSAAYYREDGKNQKRFLARADFSSKINKNTDLGVGLSFQHKNNNDTRSYTQPPLILDPYTFSPIGIYDTTLYSDTKRREISTNIAALDINLFNVNNDNGTKIIGGIETSYGTFDNAFYNVFTGFENDYENNFNKTDTLATKGDGSRFKAAAYFSGELKLLDPLTFIAGLRYDIIVDDFNSTIPDTTNNKTYSAFSPKFALNLKTGETKDYSGSIFISYSKAFKAPTIDQRTDLKQLQYAMFFPTGSEAYQMVLITGDPFSNGDLKPQRSTNYEIGTYQFYRFSKTLSLSINLTGYLTKVQDEIDFDIATLKYKNILDSEHTGLEMALNLNYKDFWNGFFNLNYTEVKFTSGEFQDNFLKGIPKTSFSGGLSYSPVAGFGGALVYRGAGGIYLDDENTQKLDGYGVFSARVDYRLSFVTIYLDCENIVDNSYNSTGYMVYGAKSFFPAVGRFIRGGLNFSF